MIHDPGAETLERPRLAELQSGRLRELAVYVYERVGPYRERFDESGVQPDRIRSLDDLRRRASGLLEDTIGCTTAVTVVAPGTRPRSEGGKLPRVLDNRPRADA